MTSWIIGGLIVGLALFIIIRSVRRSFKGEGACGGCSCGSSSQCCDDSSKER